MGVGDMAVGGLCGVLRCDGHVVRVGGGKQREDDTVGEDGCPKGWRGVRVTEPYYAVQYSIRRRGQEFARNPS